jgi:hypothetical protein
LRYAAAGGDLPIVKALLNLPSICDDNNGILYITVCFLGNLGKRINEINRKVIILLLLKDC